MLTKPRQGMTYTGQYAMHTVTGVACSTATPVTGMLLRCVCLEDES